VGTTTVTVLFCDLVGSTALQSRIGDDAADEVRREFFRVLRSVVGQNGGTVVKTMGDGAMAAFWESAVGALRCAIALTEVAPGIAGGLAVRVGVSHGEVTSEDGDLFGTPVVEAARLESAAKPGSVLAAQVVRTIVGSRGGFSFGEVQRLNLKGIEGPVPAVAVRSGRAEGVVPGPIPSPRQKHVGYLRRRTLELHWPRRRVLVSLAIFTVLLSLGFTFLSISVHLQNAPATAASKTQTEAGYTPRYVPEVCPPAAGGPNVGRGITCGRLVVPEDRTKPSGPTVRLLVIRAAAQTSQPAADPVVDVGQLLRGSGEGTSSPTRLYAEHIDLIPRGTAGSVPELDCPEVLAAKEAVLALPPLDPSVPNTIASALRACRARVVAAGIDPNAFGADAAAADVRDLLRVLHIKQANLVGYRESGLVIFNLMRQFPHLVRTATIEDAIPPGFDSSANLPANLSADVSRYAKLCTTDPACRAAFPDIRAQAIVDYKKLQSNPVTVDVTPQAGSPPIPVLVNGDRAVQALRDGFLYLEELPIIAAGIYNPDPTILAGAALDSCCLGLNTGTAWGTMYSYLCKDFVPNDSPGRIQADLRAYPQFVGVGTINASLCAAWNVQPDDPNDANSIVSAIPTFLFSGAFDASRSPVWSSDIAQGLSHSVVVQFPSMTDGSNVRAPICLSQLRIEFLQHPTRRLNSASCEAQSPPLMFAGT
jgi:class 3 adenylate cyclase/pimeloyl-ACP methyl ester carboxylesterase